MSQKGLSLEDKVVLWVLRVQIILSGVMKTVLSKVR